MLYLLNMAAKDEKTKALWVGWTHDAMIRYTVPDGVKDDEDLTDSMVDVATDYADAMLEEYQHRFEEGAKRRRKKPDDDDDDDDDDD